MSAEMPTPMVWTSLPDAGGGDRVYLDSLGPVSELKFSHGPTGCKALSCRLMVGPDFSHRALTPGRDLGVTVGGDDVWLGEAIAPTVDEDGSRLIVGEGDAVKVGQFVALGLATHNALNPNEVIDAATLSGRHSRYRRNDTLPVPVGQYAQDGSLMMDEALTQAATASGKQWRVDLDRIIRFYDLAGDGTRYVLRARMDIPRSLKGFVTRLDGAFVDAITGQYRVEHWDAPYGDTGGTHYPSFYTADGSAYSQRNFTLYSDGVKTWAYVMQAPTAAVTMVLSTGQTLTKIETSQFYTRWEGPTSTSLTGGRTASYRDAANVVLGTGTQDGKTHKGEGSLAKTGNIAPREAVVDLTGQGSFTQAEVLEQLKAGLKKAKSQPHYDGAWLASAGDLTNHGGVPVDLVSVRPWHLLTVVLLDPTKNLSNGSDDVRVLIGEVEYAADTNTLTLTPAAAPEAVQARRYVDPVTGLYR